MIKSKCHEILIPQNRYHSNTWGSFSSRFQVRMTHSFVNQLALFGSSGIWMLNSHCLDNKTSCEVPSAHNLIIITASFSCPWRSSGHENLNRSFEVYELPNFFWQVLSLERCWTYAILEYFISSHKITCLFPQEPLGRCGMRTTWN
jgi:hypothetical protein